jgi:hypothetical protein
MSYLGNQPAANFASVTKDTFSGDGSTTAFTLSKAATTNGVAVFVENVRQEPTTAYAVSGTTLTFTAAPVSASGNNIYVLHHNAVASTATHPAGQDLTAVNGTLTGTLGVTGTSTLTGDATLSRAETDGTVRLSLSNTGSNGSSEYSEIKLSSTAGTAATSIFQHRNNYGLNLGTTTNNAIYVLQNNSTHTTFETDGDVNIADGNLVLDSGNGIDFSDTANTSASSASATSELLDDYEEGTWTPVFADANSGGNTGSYSSGGSAGNRYIKVGNLVYITCELFDINTSGMTGGNVVYIRGLPFSGHSSGTYNVGAVHMNVVSYNANGAYYTFMDNNTYFRIYEQGNSGAGHNSVKVEDINSTNSDIVVTLMYFSS